MELIKLEREMIKALVIKEILLVIQIQKVIMAMEKDWMVTEIIY